MFFVKTNNLFKIATGGAILSTGLAFYAIRRQKNIYRDTKFFQDAMDILEAHAGAKLLLGSPISATRVELVPSEEQTQSPIAAFTARLSGSKEKGRMFFWAERKAEGENVKIEINRIEVQVDSDDTKRLVVKA